MSKECSIFEHTADIGLEASADTLGELFEALAEGMAGLICPTRQVVARDKRSIDIRAEDVEALAVDFLTEVLIVIQTGHFLVTAVKVRQISDNAVAADVEGEPYEPERHELDMEIKAVTYHQLRVAQEDDRWIGRVILDI